MSEPLKTPPLMGGPKTMCGHGSSAQADAIAEGIQHVIEGLGRVFGSKSDGECKIEEPSALVTVTKTVTVYEFDAEAVGRAFVKTAGAVVKGFKWPAEPVLNDPVGDAMNDEPMCSEPMPPGFQAAAKAATKVGFTASDLIQAFFSNTQALEGPDGKLKPEVVQAIVSSLAGTRSSVAATIIQNVVPEKHRQEVLEAFKAAEDARVRENAAKFQAAQDAARATKPPIVPPAPEAPKA